MIFNIYVCMYISLSLFLLGEKGWRQVNQFQCGNHDGCPYSAVWWMLHIKTEKGKNCCGLCWTRCSELYHNENNYVNNQQHCYSSLLEIIIIPAPLKEAAVSVKDHPLLTVLITLQLSYFKNLWPNLVVSTIVTMLCVVM